MTDTAAGETAPPAAAAQVKTPKKKKAAPRNNSAGPTLSEKILKIVADCSDRRGTSLPSIKKPLRRSGVDVGRFRTQIKQSIRRNVNKCSLVQNSGTGSSGSLRIPKQGTKGNVGNTVKSGAAKKPSVKKTAGKKVTAKKSAAKKLPVKKLAAKKSAAKKAAGKKVTSKKAATPKKSPAKKAALPKKVPVKKAKKPRVPRAERHSRKFNHQAVFLENVIRDLVTNTEHAKRKTVTTMDVVYALKRQHVLSLDSVAKQIHPFYQTQRLF
ncbi:histone H1-like [Heterodontus francisci]|uniref:histone H1-like n=1 Tax=Heterodontus francisci TaxID=7792 RepID=UPI00355B47E3